MTDNQPVAGWYPDPSHEGQLRYWDGAEWTSHTHVAQAFASPSTPSSGAFSQQADASVASSAAASSGTELGTSQDHYTRVSTLSPAEAAAAQRGWPWWAWLIIAVVLAAVVAVILNAVSGANAGPADEGDTASAVPSADAPEPSAQPVADLGTSQWTTRNGVATFEVPNAWGEYSERMLDIEPDYDVDLAGAWTIDGRATSKSLDYMIVFEYADYTYDVEYTTEEIATEFFSDWAVGLEITADESETVTTDAGYEAWRREVSATENGEDMSAVQYVLREGTSELSFVAFRYNDLDGYEEELAAMVDSIDILTD